MATWRYIKQYRSQMMTVVTSLALVTMVVVPPYSHYSHTVFGMFVTAVTHGHQGWLALLALIVLGSGMMLNDRLERLNSRWLEWSPVNRKKANVAYAPIIQYRRLGWLYAAILFVAMPLLAMVEELIFRYGAGQFGLATLLIVSGPVFGLVHITSGVSLRMALYQSAAGLLMAVLYLQTGLLGVFVFHASYNFAALTLVVFELRVRTPLGMFLGRHESLHRQLPTVTAWLRKPELSTA